MRGSRSRRETTATTARLRRRFDKLGTGVARFQCRLQTVCPSVRPLVCDQHDRHRSELRRVKGAGANLHNEIRAGNKGLVLLVNNLPMLLTFLALSRKQKNDLKIPT